MAATEHALVFLGSDLEPALACACYAACSVSLSLCNKLVFSGKHFDYPLAILAFQSFCAILFLKAGELLRLSAPIPYQRDLFVRMGPVTLLFCAMLVSSGKALRLCSMPLFTVCKNLSVVCISILEWCRFGTHISAGVRLSLALMVGGSIIAANGDLSSTPVGVAWLLFNVAASVLYLFALRERLPPESSLSAKTLHNHTLTLVVFLGGATGNGELIPFLTQMAAQGRVFQLGVLLTGILGTVINLTTFWCMRLTSGTTYSFVGALNKIPVALLGHWLFHSVITHAGWMGVAVGLGAGIVYAIAKERERRRIPSSRSGPALDETERGALVRGDTEVSVDDGDGDGGADVGGAFHDVGPDTPGRTSCLESRHDSRCDVRWDSRHDSRMESRRESRHSTGSRRQARHSHEPEHAHAHSVSASHGHWEREQQVEEDVPILSHRQPQDLV